MFYKTVSTGLTLIPAINRRSRTTSQKCHAMLGRRRERPALATYADPKKTISRRVLGTCLRATSDRAAASPTNRSLCLLLPTGHHEAGSWLTGCGARTMENPGLGWRRFTAMRRELNVGCSILMTALKCRNRIQSGPPAPSVS